MLALDHPFRNQGIDRGFRQAGRNAAPRSISRAIIDKRGPIGADVGQKLLAKAVEPGGVDGRNRVGLLWHGHSYGTGKYEKCADCMVHCGFEATAVEDAFDHPLQALGVALGGIRTKGPMGSSRPSATPAAARRVRLQPARRAKTRGNR